MSRYWLSSEKKEKLAGMGLGVLVHNIAALFGALINGNSDFGMRQTQDLTSEIRKDTG